MAGAAEEANGLASLRSRGSVSPRNREARADVRQIESVSLRGVSTIS